MFMYAPAKIEGRERTRKENLGQFLTPVAVGDFIASFLTALPAHVRLLDAGAGAGALTAALVRQIILFKLSRESTMSSNCVTLQVMNRMLKAQTHSVHHSRLPLLPSQNVIYIKFESLHC